MCRLLGVVSRDRSPLTETVPDELPLFTALSERHKDGWGVAWYDPAGHGAAPEVHTRRLEKERADAASGLEVRRGIDTARASSEYGEAVAEAQGEICLVHLRRASEGMVLRLENTHPFTEGPVAFAHNGQFDLPVGAREAILERGGRAPAGTTDSELYFSLVSVHAREHGWGAEAVQRAAADLTDLIPSLGGRYPEGLNCLLITPESLVAYAQHDPDQLEPTSPWETYELRCREDADRVVVSSSGFPFEGSAPIDQGQAVTVHRDSLAVQRHAPLPGFRLSPGIRRGREAWEAARAA